MINGRFESLIRYNQNVGGAKLTDNNQVQIFIDGKDKFQTLLREIYCAEHYIYMQYYIIKNDELWKQIENVLKEKVCQGVEVRILFDHIGCREMKECVWNDLKKAGIQVADYFPRMSKHFKVRANYRNHRKIVVVDGRVGFVGGFNIGKEYLGKDEKFGYWRDAHLELKGDAVRALLERFALDWNIAAGEKLSIRELMERNIKEIQCEQNYVQVISSGPDTEQKLIRDNYLKLIHLAKESIFIQTPYFIPDKEILEALKMAVHSGIDLRIMIPCKPDHAFVYWATYSYIGDLVKIGAKCYTYDNGFLHAKCMCVDSCVTCMGTANMDIRSFVLNHEINVMIYNDKITKKLEKAFLDDMRKSTRITKKTYRKRPFFIKCKERCCRLLSPIL